MIAMVNSEVKKTLYAIGERRIVESNSSSNSWYRKWSDGFVEQGGTGSASYSNRATITFPISFLNDNFSLCVSNKTNTNGEGYYWNAFTVVSRTKSSCVVSNWGGLDKFSWFACGYS